MEFVAAALTSASESEQEVTALLYGFDGHRRTPEEVAQHCGLSLPQVGQTAKAALRRMRQPACSRLIREGLVSANERIWSALAGSHGIVYKAERLSKTQASLPGDLLFAIESQYGSVENWLSANARVTAKAWYRSGCAAAEIEWLVGMLSTEADEFRLPAPVESLARAMNVEAECLDMAARLSDVWAVYAGYAVRTPVGTRAPRAVRLHRMLASAHSDEMVPARRLVIEYRSEFADDACTVIDAQNSMASFPHLFLRSGDLGWCSIGAAGNREPAPDGSAEDDVTFHRWSEERRAHQELTDREVIRQVLEEHGPLRLHQVRRFVRTQSNGRIPPASVGTYLAACDDFMRLAPGVYGLSDRPAGAGQFAASTRLLLNRGACLQYVLARWAGEPADAYPLWTPEMEAEWCEWAQAREKNLLGSLLSVVDPSSWRTPASYRDIWLWKKECLGYFRLEKPPRYPLTGVPLAQLLALVKCAQWRGAANWVLANRVAGERVLNRGAVSLMALLIGVGAVLPASHWQKPHAVSPGARQVDAMLSEELHSKGALAWNGSAGLALLERLAKTIDRGETGWISHPELRRLLDRLRDSEPALS
jgi:hypothetical protein